MGRVKHLVSKESKNLLNAKFTLCGLLGRHVIKVSEDTVNEIVIKHSYIENRVVSEDGV